MGTMLVISTTAVPPHVRGALSRWLIEPKAGLYVGTVSARVREELWDAVSRSVGDGAAVCINPTDNEQRFLLRTAGERRREVVDFDGLQLIRLLGLEEPEEPPPAPAPPDW